MAPQPKSGKPRAAAAVARKLSSSQASPAPPKPTCAAYLGGAEEGRLREDEPLEREHYDRSHAVQRGGPHRSHFAVATVALVGVGAVKQLQS